MLICQATGVAVAGIYPLLFPPQGYAGQLRWLSDTAVCMGEEAYRCLVDAALEGNVELPTYLEVYLHTGQVVHLGPNLTVPSNRVHLPGLIIDGGLSVETQIENKIIVSYKLVEESDKVSASEQEENEYEEVEYEEDGSEEDSENEDNSDDRDLKEETRNVKDEERKCHNLYVEYAGDDIKEVELHKHFSLFGKIDIVLMNPKPVTRDNSGLPFPAMNPNMRTPETPRDNSGTSWATKDIYGTPGTPRDNSGTPGTPRDNSGTPGTPRDNSGTPGTPRDNSGTPGTPRVNYRCATITFASAAVVEYLSGREHHLVRYCNPPAGRTVKLRLKGGSGRPPVPPRHQNHLFNPFR